MTGGGTIVLAIQPFVPKDVVGIEDTTLAALQASPEKLQSTVVSWPLKVSSQCYLFIYLDANMEENEYTYDCCLNAQML